MKRSQVRYALAVVLLVGCGGGSTDDGEIATVSLPAQQKVEVCHYNGKGVGHVISIAAPAWPAHSAHGDHMVGAELCDGIDNDCDGEVDEGSVCVFPSCAEIRAVDPTAGDGIYTIEPVPGDPMQVHCLMSEDGGGWTLVANYPWRPNTTSVPGWNSGNAVGSSLTDLTQPFKFSDAMMNTLKTEAYRMHGTASVCTSTETYPGTIPCDVDTLFFYRGDCVYSSSTVNPHCGDAFFDAEFELPVGPEDGWTGSQCGWHWGLVSVRCGTTSTLITSHNGDRICVGMPYTNTHACYGRADEDPSLKIWVR